MEAKAIARTEEITAKHSKQMISCQKYLWKKKVVALDSIRRKETKGKCFVSEERKRRKENKGTLEFLPINRKKTRGVENKSLNSIRSLNVFLRIRS